MSAGFDEQNPYGDVNTKQGVWQPQCGGDHGCPVPLTVRGTQALVGFAPLAPSVFCAARQNAVLRRSPLRPT